MRLLAVSHDYPQPDQNSGDLRFFSLLTLLAKHGEVSFWSQDQRTDDFHEAAAAKLQSAGVRTQHGTFEHVLRQHGFDVVLFELYFVADALLETVRIWQPTARIVVDSVDVHFHRLESKARLSGSVPDSEAAAKVRARELDVYGRADVVVAVTDEDQQVLRRAGLRTPTLILPNVHVMHELQPKAQGDRLELVFVGSYKWSPNVDAMVYFCGAVMPLLRKLVSKVRLRIVGSSPTPEVSALACEDIEVVGYVDDTTPYLSSSDVSVAPLRFGGGMKGKIGEALAHGLPVVTTPVGAEGFGFTVGEHVLVGSTPDELASLIAKLWTERDTYDRIRAAGWAFVNERLSTAAVARQIPDFIKRTMSVAPQRMPTLRRMLAVGPHYFDRHVGWRFR